MTTSINTSQLIVQLRAAGRDELIHYAGAAHRDLVAWHMCAAYLADQDAPEHVLKSRALKEAHGIDITPEQIDAARASYDPEARSRVQARMGRAAGEKL